MSAPRFIAYRGLDSTIQNLPIMPNLGYVYFATDTGKIYMDYYDKRLVMGSTGASLLYADAESPEVDEFGKYSLSWDDLEDQKTEPKIDDLILNSDGSFYRIEEIFPVERIMYCARVTVSGSGTGPSGPSTDKQASIKIGQIKNLNLINGQDFDIPITGTAEYQDGEPVDESIFINYEIYVADDQGQPVGSPYVKSTMPAKTGVETVLKAGPLLRHSTRSTFKLWVTSSNGSRPSRVNTSIVVYCDNLELKKSSEFSNLSVFSPDGISVKCLAVGNMGKILKYTWDDEVLYTDRINANDARTEFSYTIPASYASHGLHILKIDLYQRTTLDEEGKNVGPLIYEIAVAEPNNMKPIIWFGDYKNEYKNYDNIKIPFLVYDPFRQNEGVTEVNFYKRGINLEIPREVSCTAQNSKYNYFEITDADHNMENFYSISCGDKAVPELYDEHPIRFSLVTDDRDMTLDQASQIIVNFSARGRSNNEAASRRASWSQEVNGTTVKGIFNNFNWKNNGWMMEAENDNETCLRISNGASFKIPFGGITMAAGTNPSAAFEMQFKIRNVQDYGNLIQNITRYVGDDLFYTYGFTKQTKYTNYDAFLNDFLRTYPLDGIRDVNGDLVTDEQGNTLYYPTDGEGGRISYDDLKFSRIQKNIDLSKTICRYISGTGDSVVGFALGTQDCFFSNGSNKVTAPYIEDEMVNLTIVYTHSATSENSRLMTIYVNGMMTGVINSTVSSNDGFTIDSEGVEFNSTYCDIDLFKFRVYKDFLNVKNVVKNFAVDRLDVDVYDQNNIAELDNTINEYRLNFNKMLEYNESRKKNNEEPLMPYIIFDTSNSPYDDKLSWSKSTDIPITVTFKNTGLDYAYETGELERLLLEKGIITASEEFEVKQEKIKRYYQHHCPSWTGNYVNMAVQGTSSEFYPRRNYKLKTKTSHDPKYEDDVVNIHLNAGPFATDYEADPESTRQEFFYMNNDVVGTTKFTMKIDYMESSGTYNIGFANLVGNAYAKHPLAYYDEVKAFQKTGTSYVAATGAFDPDNKYFIYSDSEYVEDKTVTEATYDVSKHFVENITYTDTTLNVPGAYRTSVQGYPVLAFHKKSNGSYHYIGRYNMLLDKGSDECFGFKPSKSIVNKFALKNGVPQTVRKAAECWEFSNNSRTYCSFRDPQNRYNLSFKVDATYDSQNPPKQENGSTISKEDYEISGALNSARSCPIVADSFEYRYHDAGDTFDYIYDPAKNSDKMEDAREELGDGLNSIGERSEFLYKKYTNWEKAVQWVWSTNDEYVGSENIYEKLEGDQRVGAALYSKGQYYIRIVDEETGNYSYVISNDEYNSAITYYNKKEIEKEDGTKEEVYENAYIVPVNAYEAGKYFILSDDGSYVLDYSSFDSSVQYYSATKIDLNSKTDEELLVLKIYKLTPPEGIEFNDWDGITYNDKTYYRYDTKEYRAAKFRNELNKHFNSEYLSTYFVMTEVFECYDSRGKNAMFASWGPMEEGGDYIWFPIFYDIDTQLGINNTGIPSFEYSIDATVEGTFSTSDSVLWNNYYKYFKAEIIQKYKQLKGENSSYAALTKPPLSSVNNIRQWYKADPVVCDNMAMRGQRPLIALNLDEYYKYLTIMNNADLTTGKTGYIDGGSNYITDNGTYLYALQGDRDLYITQFITNRIDYIDSWLNVGNYQRGGANNIWGRMAANNKDKISDLWVEKAGEAPYYDASGNKVNEFDAEYWATVTPIRKTYVTVQDDNGAYPSVKYNGSPVKVYYTALESGVRSSANYPEQLVYIYGIDSMGDIGDISKMYWQEFKIVGNAKKLRKLQYGYDALMTDAEGNVRMFDANDPILTPQAKVTYGDDPSKVACRWYNSKVNPPSMPSGKEDSGMPLLQEVNFSNIQVNTNSPSLNLTSCEKLQNFRATGSNFSSIKFADGVALNTLYLPGSLLRLELTEARLLDHIIQSYEYPVKNKNTNNLEAKPGLYIEGFTDCGNGVPYKSSLNTINIVGDNLKYDSYILMNKLKEKQLQVEGGKAYLTLTDVKWSPYELLTEGDIYDTTAYDYYIDDNHYGVVKYTYEKDTFELDVLNGKLYRKAKNAIMDTIKDIEIFKYFLRSDSIFASATSSSQKIPNISGTIYIDNEEAVDEVYIKNSLAVNFPSLTFIFKKVNKAYSAKFLIPELIFDEATDSYITSGIYKYAPLKDSKEPSVQKISINDMAQDGVWFTSPYDLYIVEKTNFVFDGWGYYNPTTKQITPIPEADWDNFKNSSNFNSNILEYEFHALFTIHQYQITYHNTTYDFSTGVAGNTVITIPYGEYLEVPETVPITDESTLPDNKRYRFVGYSSNSRHYIFSTEAEAKANKVEPQTMVADSNRDFYAMYIEEDATLVASPNEYFDFTLSTTGYTSKVNDRFNIASGYTIKPKAGTTLAGKITIPSTYNDLPVFKMISNWSSPYITHVYFLENGKNMRFVSGFSESQNLRIFDFPSGCNEIENNAFTKCSKLIFTEKFNQMPLGRIGDQAFQGAFNMASRQSEDLLIPASLYHLGSNAIRNLSGYNSLTYYFNNLRFGDTQNPFDINKLSGAIKGSLRQNTSINIVNIYNTITFYLSTGTVTEENKTNIYDFLKKAMEITTDITGPEGLKPYYGNITFVEV